MHQQKKQNKMKTKEQTTRQPVPVMKQLAREMSKEELETVAGAPGGCAPSSGNRVPDDFEF